MSRLGSGWKCDKEVKVKTPHTEDLMTRHLPGASLPFFCNFSSSQFHKARGCKTCSRRYQVGGKYPPPFTTATKISIHNFSKISPGFRFTSATEPKQEIRKECAVEQAGSNALPLSLDISVELITLQCNAIHCEQIKAKFISVGPEGYHLEVKPT